jgi:hypothetical protein
MSETREAPLPCHWYENPDHPGERFLVPCCPERVQDLDAECQCELPVDELVRLRREVADLTTDRDRTRRELRALEMAVARRTDHTEIFDKARALRAELRNRA